MAYTIEINSADDPALAPYARLTERQLRTDGGVFIAESVTVIKLAMDAGIMPLSLLAERQMIDGQAAGIISRCGDVPVYTADGELLREITGFSLSRGVMAVMKRPALPTAEEVCAEASRIAVLEDIADATNVGAIIRSAAALGIEAVLVTPSCSDPLNRRSARVSMGTVFQIPWTYIGADRDDWLQNGIGRLHSLGFETAAMALRDDPVSVDDLRLKKAERLAIILGTEGHGLCENTMEKSDYTVKIPMYHGVDSLNVAAASAVAFWEMRCR